MLPEERKHVILQIINERKAARVADLSSALNITEATVRRDLDELQSEHKIRRTHGGALSIHPYPAAHEWNVQELVQEHQEEKRAIAAKAYEFVDDNDTLIMDNSTTVRALVSLLKTKRKKRLTIITASFTIVSDLIGTPDYEIIHVGGSVRVNTNGTLGPIAERALADLRADKTFLGVNGISIDFGYSVPHSHEASLKMQMIRSAKQTIVLADHSKFDKSYLCRVAPVDGVDYLITDGIAPAMLEELQGFDINCVLAT
jgi:DeoR family fructose operon transcriptional repressor